MVDWAQSTKQIILVLWFVAAVVDLWFVAVVRYLRFVDAGR